MAGKPIWSEGLLVSQHHFQQQDRYHEQLLDARVRSLARYDWGITELEIDTLALASGQFRIQRCSAIWPDGASIRCGDSHDPAPPPRNFEAALPADPKTPLEIFLGVAHEAELSSNLARPGEQLIGRRYLQTLRSVMDMNTGGSPQEVEWARPDLRVFFGSERQDGYSTIRIAELVRQANGQVIVKDNHVPPVLHIGAAAFLHSGLRRVLNSVVARQRELAAERSEQQPGHIEFHAAQARKFWFLHTLNGAIPALSHLMDTPRTHPEQAFLSLATLAGQLATFAHDADPLKLPKFDYLDLGGVFESLIARVLFLLSSRDDPAYTEIALQTRDDGTHLGRLTDPRVLGREWFVAVRASNMLEGVLRDRLPGVMKIADWNQIRKVVREAGQGVQVTPEWQPSGLLPQKPGSCLFRVRREGTYWDDIVKSESVALYLPKDDDWGAATLELYAMDSAHLR